MPAQERQALYKQNCAAIPETLLESILFGTVKEVLPVRECGLFELQMGYLILDEIPCPQFAGKTLELFKITWLEGLATKVTCRC